MIRLRSTIFFAMLVWLALLPACADTDSSQADMTLAEAAASWQRHSFAGMVAMLQSHYSKAENEFEVALTAAEVFGPQDPRFATGLNNLGTVYLAQDRYAEAEPLLQQALELKEQVLGPEHPSVYRGLVNLAVVYQSQGKYTEAEPLYQRSLEISERIVGPEHPDVATNLENYAVLLRETGRGEEAKEMEARAKAIRAKYE